MFGLDLYDRGLIKSPTVIVTAASGEGKSFLAAMLITDIRAHRGNVKVRVMDYRHSFKPICKLFGGRHIEFNEADPKPINIWNYPGIEEGNRPTKAPAFNGVDGHPHSKQDSKDRRDHKCYCLHCYR
ncbi:MAG: hypothetical protein IPQ00_17460 [Chloracidobacterium sp.]|nr:hypothetical protein [Chloracidobacterium sp.]